MKGIVRAAASWKRRGTMPQSPPVRWFSMARARHPTTTPSQNSHPTRYERKN